MENWLTQDSPILTFNDSTYSGNGGCNAFFGRCKIDGKNIIINDWSTTTINCVGKRGDVENIIGNNFNNFHYFIKSDSLLLTNKDNITLTYIKSK